MAGTIYPVYNNVFKIAKDGRTGENLVVISDMESFSVAFDDVLQKFNTLDAGGWQRALKTGKGITISLKGKRSVGDEGNDYVAGLVTKNGTDCNSVLEWTMPSGDKIKMPCVVDVKSAGGSATDIDALEFDLVSDGKPEVTPAHG